MIVKSLRSFWRLTRSCDAWTSPGTLLGPRAVRNPHVGKCCKASSAEMNQHCSCWKSGVAHTQSWGSFEPNAQNEISNNNNIYIYIYIYLIYNTCGGPFVFVRFLSVSSDSLWVSWPFFSPIAFLGYCTCVAHVVYMHCEFCRIHNYDWIIAGVLYLYI